MNLNRTSRFIRLLFKVFSWLFKPWWSLGMRMTKKKGHPIRRKNGEPFTAWDQIAEAIRFGKRWASDPIKGAVDYMGHPTGMQYHVDMDSDPASKRGLISIGDCDDHAAYWAAALLKYKLADEVYLASVQVQTKYGNVGHAICVFQSNGYWYYADYHRPYQVADKWGFAKHYADKFEDGVAYAKYLVHVPHCKEDGTLILGKWWTH